MAKAAQDPLKTQKTATVPIDLSKGGATLTAQWLLEKEKSNPLRPDCAIETFIGGQDGFARIAKDLEEAKGTVNLVCWGFDPGMALVRNQSLPAYPWANGEPYGELIKRIAAKGVTVKLLVWYNKTASSIQNSLVGYVVHASLPIEAGVITMTKQELRGIKPNGPADMRQDYCTMWWRQATEGKIKNLEVRCRDVDRPAVKSSLATEADQPGDSMSDSKAFIATGASEKDILLNFPTHHQKPIVIDYDFEGGRKAVGYVMGLNSVSDYWDTQAHEFDSPERERHLVGSNDDMADTRLRQNKPISRKPFQDYACRLQGPVLMDVHKNFCTAWNRAASLPAITAKPTASTTQVKEAPEAPPLLSKLGQKISAQAGQQFKASLQVLRTQPEEKRLTTDGTYPRDKSIKSAYFQASSFARNYIYLENQYFFYEEWARHIKENRQSFMEWLKQRKTPVADAKVLHLIAVIPKPERQEMVPRTYDTLKSLGQASSMPKQHQQVTKEADQFWNPNSEVTKTALAVKAPTPGQDGVLMQDGNSLGLKTLICKMATPNKSGNKELGAARDIYIHSKLLLIDDCFMTLGSANLNQRSMAVDTEINVATDSIPHNLDLRRRVWSMQTGGDTVATGGAATTVEIAKAFERWEKLAAENAGFIAKNQPKKMQGFLVSFSDDRTSTSRMG